MGNFADESLSCDQPSQSSVRSFITGYVRHFQGVNGMNVKGRLNGDSLRNPRANPLIITEISTDIKGDCVAEYKLLGFIRIYIHQEEFPCQKVEDIAEDCRGKSAGEDDDVIGHTEIRCRQVNQ